MLRTAFLLGLVPAAASAQLVSPSAIHNAGPVKGGTALSQTFELHNAGDRPLEVIDVRTGCGCAKAVPDRRSFAAGEKGTVRLDVHTVTQTAGPNVWGAEMRYRTAAGQEGVMNVRLTAHVNADVQIRPAALVLHTAASVRHPFVLTERRPKPLALRSAATTSEHVRAEASEPVQQGGGWVRSVQLAVLPSCPEGRHECSLVLTTDDPMCPELRAPFTVIKKSADAIQVSPPSVEWRAGGTEALPARLAVLRSGDDAPVVIESVSFSHAGMSATWVSGPRATVRFVIDRGQVPAGGLEASAEVKLSAPRAQTVRVPLVVGE